MNKIAALVGSALFFVIAPGTLTRQFGAEYESYVANVPRWLPRHTPWRGSSA